MIPATTWSMLRRASQSSGRIDAYPAIGDTLLVPPPAWHAQAACRGKGTVAFFTEQPESLRAATEMCDGYFVRESASRPFWGSRTVGIWGGLSERDRRRLKRAAA